VYYRLNREIHEAIVRCAGNPELEAVYLRMNARLQALRFRSNLNRDKWDAALREHHDMIDALTRRDARKLGALLRAHLDAKRDAVLAQWVEPNQDTAR
jgi:DNA-binding GntR family transcriptional regulator